jgi:hypothetical protein
MGDGGGAGRADVDILEAMAGEKSADAETAECERLRPIRMRSDATAGDAEEAIRPHRGQGRLGVRHVLRSSDPIQDAADKMAAELAAGKLKTLPHLGEKDGSLCYYCVTNDWLTMAEGDSAATLGCGCRGVRRGSEGKSCGRSLQLRGARLPLSVGRRPGGYDSPHSVIGPPLSVPSSRGSHGSRWTGFQVVVYVHSQ